MPVKQTVVASHADLEHFPGVFDAPDACIHLFITGHLQRILTHVPFDFRGDPVSRRQIADGPNKLKTIDVPIAQGYPVKPDAELIPVEFVIAEMVAKRKAPAS